ncbi:MAG: efflux RND transporter periplasmic adaptor subunit [Rudaea sp.]|uniref:efflux RND transporter periplasmic adaptor subunit n=1 Tax=unclassified Rudaea TaxID=2627037 RepID=UPI0010F59AAE|nr:MULTISPECIES: efflux RND transporter periplasmic adaptor subunit [unclassified Rudaea]MBN8885680.1 efflux RND transporter periplasmic adaptor subunit [Rudaea sp.]
MRNSLFTWLATGAIGSLACILCACGSAHDAQTKTAGAPAAADGCVVLTPAQAKQVAVHAAALHEFVAHVDAVGYVDFDQDATVQVFTPYQGRVRQVFAALGDKVKKGQPLFSVDSPDLVQAQSSLITAAGVLALTTRTLERAKQMLGVQASAQKDVEQATSDQQTAEGNFKAARNALRIFGKTDAQIDAVVASRKTDGELVVASPFDGEVTARNAAVGLLLQPGSAPAPFTISRTSVVWLTANAQETDLPALRVGQAVTARVNAFRDRAFEGKVAAIGASLDPNTHRASVRVQIDNPQNELRPQMLATFVIRTGEPLQAVAVPSAGLVREGDGTMTVFVTEDGKRFSRRAVVLGMDDGSLHQVISGLAPGEKVASEGALFVSNALAVQTR